MVHLTGLKPPTVYRIFSLLEERGLIYPVGEASVAADRKGRRPSPYSVVPSAHYSIGVDFWARTAAVTLFDFAGKIVYRRSTVFESEISATEVTEELVRLIGEATRSGQVSDDRLLGIGIGAPGVVDVENGVVVEYERIGGMRGYDLGPRIADRFDIPVEVHNNCSVIALGAHRYGRAERYDCLGVLLVRSGMGGALIRGGQLYVSQNRTALEIGNFLVTSAESDYLLRERGIRPYGGLNEHQNGQVATGGPRQVRATKLEDFICEDTIFRTVSAACGVESWEELDLRLRNGEKEMTDVLAPFGELFSNAALDFSLLLNPEAVMIVSRFRSLSEYFGRELARRMPKGSDSVRINVVEILSEEYDATLACRGAADLILDTYFSVRH